MSKSLVLLLGLTLASSAPHAVQAAQNRSPPPTRNLTGVVLDGETMEPIVDATIRTIDASVVTGTDGRFLFP